MARASSVISRVLIVSLAVVCCGCAVLTDSQIDAVKSFSKATDDYKQLPGSLITNYASLQRDRDLIKSATTQASAPDTWTAFDDTYAREHQLDASAKKMDEALTILNIYSSMLSSIISSDYSDALGKSATTMGQDLDSATAAYNKKFSANLPAVGGSVGEIIRGAGGLYIRYKQAIILRDALAKTAPLIDQLMTEVKRIAAAQEDNFKQIGEHQFKDAFMNYLRGRQGIDLASLRLLYDDYSASRNGVELSQQVGTAAESLNAAMKKLVDETRVRKDLPGIIDEIKTLSDEVNAANKVKNEIDQKTKSTS